MSSAEAGSGKAEESSTAEKLDDVLLGGAPSMTLTGLAEAAGVSEATARGFWRSLGFPDVSPEALEVGS